MIDSAERLLHWRLGSGSYFAKGNRLRTKAFLNRIYDSE